MYNYAIDNDDNELLKNYNLNIIAENNNLVIDASRMLEPQCVICLKPGKITDKQKEKTTNKLNKLSDPSYVSNDSSKPKILQPQIASEFAQTNNNYTMIADDENTFSDEVRINNRLHKGWLYWTTDSGALAAGEPARGPRPVSHYPDPRCNAPDECKAHSLGHYGNHELLMTEADYRRGVLGDFLLFLLPQADPRPPAAPTSGGSQGGGGGGSGKPGSS